MQTITVFACVCLTSDCKGQKGGSTWQPVHRYISEFLDTHPHKAFVHVCQDIGIAFNARLLHARTGCVGALQCDVAAQDWGSALRATHVL